MANEPEVIANWLFARLTTAPAVTAVFGQRIYPDEVPENVTIAPGEPYITYGQQSDVSVSVLPVTRLYVNDLWNVQCWVLAGRGPGTYAAINDGFSAVDAALHGQAGTATGGRVIACVREQVLRSVPPGEGVRGRRIIGLYRIHGRVE